MEARLQAQVRALSREVGTLKEELGREVKRRERLAVRCKEQEELQAAAEAKTKALSYVNSKLEQELATLRDRTQTSNVKSKCGLEALRQRLTEVEKSVVSRAVESQRQLQQVRGMVQDLAGVAVPLAVVAAAAGGKQQPQRGPVLRGASAPTRQAGQHAGVSRPAELQQRFSQVLAALNLLSETITGRTSFAEDSSADTTPAPLLLTAPDGSTKSVHWKGEEPATAPAAAGRQRHAAQAAGLDAEKEQLRAQVQQLQAELSLARSRSGGSSNSSQIQAAMQQLEAVVPQYRAAASALQGQVTVLKEKLAATVRERVQAQEEAGQWRSRAARLEAALGEVTARVHAKDAQALVLSSQAQSEAERLSGDVETLRQRCAELGSLLRSTQQEVARLQVAVREKEKLVAMQQGTIRQLETTIQEQQSDIRTALALVTGRGSDGGGPAASAAAAAAAADVLLQSSGCCSDWGDLHGGGLVNDGLAGSSLAGGGFSGSPHASALVGERFWGCSAAGGGTLGVSHDESLPGTAPLAAGAELEHALESCWSIPAGSSSACCGGADSLGAVSCSPRLPHSPAVSSAAVAAAAAAGRQHKAAMWPPGAGGLLGKRPSSAAASGNGRGVASIEAEIAGLEDALRQALTDLNV